MKTKQSTPWGPADHVKHLNPEGTVIEVGTSGHGGIGIRADQPIPAYIQPYAFNEGGWNWFEEDQDWACAALACPECFDEKARQYARDTVINHMPSVCEAHFGFRPNAAQSRAVREAELKERLRNNYRVRTAFGDWAWDVPKGHVYVTGHRESDGSDAGFLVPEHMYVNLDELVLDNFPQWNPDTSLPYSKPRETAAISA